MPIDMNALARLGAQTRLAELAAEMDSIRRAFPDLGGSPDKWRRRPGRQRKESPPPEEVPRRKPMSAAAKKAVGKRMKKYWAQRKAAGIPATESPAETKPGKGATKTRTMSAEARAKISAAQKKRWKAQKRSEKKR